jgi:hypothetical protein
MCIVVDINTLAPVFNEKCEKHPEFLPIREWVEKGQSFIVFGGTRYKRELAKVYRYLRLIRQMKDSGRAVAIRDDVVDAAESRVIEATKATDCDDQHIIALLGTSRCPLFCSADSRSYPFITRKALYPKGMARVRIYSSRKNKQLLKPMSTAMLMNCA